MREKSSHRYKAGQRPAMLSYSVCIFMRSLAEYLLTTFDKKSEELHQSNMQTVCTQAGNAQS